MADSLRQVGLEFISQGERELLANIARVDQAERNLEKTSKALEAAVKRRVATEEEAIRIYVALERVGMEYDKVQKALAQDAKMLDAANKAAVNSMLGIDRATKSARASASAFSAALKQQERDQEAAAKAHQKAMDAVYGFDRSVKSARDSARAFSGIIKALEQDEKMLDAANKAAVNSMLGVDRGFKSARASASVFSAALKEQEQAEKKAVAELERHERELEQLASKYKPLYAASKQYEMALDEINRAHSLGVLNVKQHSLAVDALQKEYQDFQNNTAGWENQFVQGGQRTARQMNRTGMFVQQLGYQAGDFFVQWQSGTNLFVAFGQQATQLVGLLGVLDKSLIGIGAVLGIAIPIVTALGAAWMRSRDAMDDSADSAKDLENELKSLDGTIRDFLRTQEALSRGISIDELIAMDSIESATEALDKAQAKLEDFQNTVVSPGYGAAGGIDIMSLIGMGDTDAYEDAVAAVEAAEQRLVVLRRKMSAERMEFVREERTELEANLRLQEIEIQYGSESAQYLREQVAQERAILVEKIEQEHVDAKTQKLLLAIFDTTNDLRITNEAYTAGLEAAKNLWGEILDRVEPIMNLTVEIERGFMSARAAQATLGQEGLQEMIDLFEASADLREELGDAAFEALRLAGVDIASGVSAAAKEAAILAGNLGVALSAALSIRNLQQSKTYSGRGSGVEYRGQSDYTADLNYVTIQEQIDKYIKSTERAGRATKKTKEEISALQKALDEAYVSTDEFADILRVDLVDATGDVADAWGDFVSSGFTDFKGFADSVLGVFKNLISDLIATATRNRIMIALGLAPSGAAAAVSGGGGGILGIGGGIANILGLGGGGIAGLAGSGGLFGTVGGIASGLGGVLSGGGLGSSFANLGGLLSGSSGITGGAIGAALPAAGIVGIGITALLKGLSRKFSYSALEGTVGAGTFDGFTRDFYKGGFLRSDKSVYGTIDPDVEAGIESQVRAMTDSLLGFGEALGLGRDALDDYEGFFLSVMTSGRSQEQIAEDIASELSEASDEMAELILATDDFSRAGETATDTLTRLGSSLLTVNDAFSLLGTTLYESSLAGGEMASQLVDLFGGLESFTATTAVYFQAFYSEEERIAALTARLVDEFADLGLTMPMTRDAFRQLVDSLDLTTDGGRQLYAELLSMASALDAVLPQIGGFNSAITGLISDINDEISAQIQAATEAQRAAESAANLWFRASENLRTFIRELTGQIATREQNLAGSRSFYQQTFTAARGGDITAAQGLTGAAQDYLDNVLATSGTALEYRRATAQVLNQIRTVESVAELEGARQDRLAALYEQQITVLGALRDYLQSDAVTQEGISEFRDAIAGLDTAIQQTTDFQVSELVNLGGSIDLARDTIGLVSGSIGSAAALFDAVGNRIITEFGEVGDQVGIALSDFVQGITDDITVDINTDRLQTALGQLQAAIDADRIARERTQQLLGLQQRGTSAASAISGNYASGQSIVAQIEELERRTGVTLGRNGGKDALLSVGDQGYVNYAADFYSYGSNSDLAAFREAFYGPNGLQAQIAAHNRDAVSAIQQAEALRQQIRDLGGVPAFADGGMHTGGLRIVGERGPELEFTGPSRIMSNDTVRGMFDMSGLRSDIRSLVNAINAMHKDNNNANISVYREVRKVAKKLTKWDTIPGSLEVTTS